MNYLLHFFLQHYKNQPTHPLPLHPIPNDHPGNATDMIPNRRQNLSQIQIRHPRKLQIPRKPFHLAVLWKGTPEEQTQDGTRAYQWQAGRTVNLVVIDMGSPNLNFSVTTSFRCFSLGKLMIIGPEGSLELLETKVLNIFSNINLN